VLHSLLAGSPHAALWLTRALQAGWLIAVVAWLARAGRGDGEFENGPVEVARTGVLLLAMLFVSPLLEPHHGVLLLLPALLALHVVFDGGRPWRLRRGLTAVVSVSFLATLLAPSGLGKGLAVNASLLLYSLASVAVARVAAPAPRASCQP
jgi:hypothetical protein